MFVNVPWEDENSTYTFAESDNGTFIVTPSDGESQQVQVYTHPQTTAVTAGMYNVGKDELGHVILGDAFTIPTVNDGTLTV